MEPDRLLEPNQSVEDTRNWMEGRAEPWEVEVYPRSLHRTTDCTRLQFSHLSVLRFLFLVDPLYTCSAWQTAWDSSLLQPC